MASVVSLSEHQSHIDKRRRPIVDKHVAVNDSNNRLFCARLPHYFLIHHKLSVGGDDETWTVRQSWRNGPLVNNCTLTDVKFPVGGASVNGGDSKWTVNCLVAFIILLRLPYIFPSIAFISNFFKANRRNPQYADSRTSTSLWMLPSIKYFYDIPSVISYCLVIRRGLFFQAQYFTVGHCWDNTASNTAVYRVVTNKSIKSCKQTRANEHTMFYRWYRYMRIINLLGQWYDASYVFAWLERGWITRLHGRWWDKKGLWTPWYTICGD